MEGWERAKTPKKREKARKIESERLNRVWLSPLPFRSPHRPLRQIISSRSRHRHPLGQIVSSRSRPPPLIDLLSLFPSNQLRPNQTLHVTDLVPSLKNHTLSSTLTHGTLSHLTFSLWPEPSLQLIFVSNFRFLWSFLFIYLFIYLFLLLLWWCGWWCFGGFCVVWWWVLCG